MNSIERLQAALKDHDAAQQASFDAQDLKRDAKTTLIAAQKALDDATAALKEAEATLELTRYGLDAARADLEAELR